MGKTTKFEFVRYKLGHHVHVAVEGKWACLCGYEPRRCQASRKTEDFIGYQYKICQKCRTILRELLNDLAKIEGSEP
jgi:hypothetical protein